MNKKVYLSPSTQEKNIGVGNYGTEEYRANLITDIVERELKRHGVTVYRNNPSMSVAQIVADANKLNADIEVPIHTNACNTKARGCEVYCYKKGEGTEGEKLANAIYLQLAPITPTNDRGIKEAKNFYGTGKHIAEVAKTKMPSALIEVAFHDNESDAQWIINNVELIGITIAKGILNYFNILYMPIVIDKNVFYRIVAGSYNLKHNAELQVEALKKLGINSFIECKKI